MAKSKAAPTAAPPPETSGEYTVVARRYRPQQFADLVGQEPVAKALVNAIQTNRVAHAYLFTGVRGVGKTSAARILAKALNCMKGPTPTPCDQCDFCKAIAEGQDVDVLEINGADNRGIDEIRTIRNNVATRPQRARYKIYIIDEVHMLTPPAFNALLKTLEEPPPHVKFILATTDVQKIPLTILSRCQRFDFGGINTTRILATLKDVVTREGVKADDDALRIIARRAAGSMRDAQSLLEQLLSFGDKLTVDVVHSILGTAADERVVAIAAAVLSKEPKQALELVARCADEGLQLGELLDQLIEYWRGLMLLNCTSGEAASDLTVADPHRDSVKAQAQAMTLDTILAGLDVLTTTKSRLRTSSHGQVLLEMTIVRLSRLDELVPVAQLSMWLSQPGSAPNTSKPRMMGSAAPAMDDSKKNGLISSSANLRLSSNGTISPPSAAPTATNLIDANLVEIWDKVKIDVGHMFAAELGKAGTPAIVGPRVLVLRFPNGYNHAYEFCKESAKTARVEAALKAATGQDWALRFELVAGPAAAPAKPLVSAKDRERRALETPLLSEIVSRLEGRLLKMDEGFGEISAAAEPVEIADPQVGETDSE
ncbi:MAG TPA: DNA polymerase III subunit gamma/tau [Gemmataceae bacterium]|jgi:DNA polymerase-3 subunit gamma/tau|nr:DNA polymerase III subunit gamma/tau [Gemmataceae bacterium]